MEPLVKSSSSKRSTHYGVIRFFLVPTTQRVALIGAKDALLYPLHTQQLLEVGITARLNLRTHLRQEHLATRQFGRSDLHGIPTIPYDLFHGRQ
jgi:hypothetical protein